VQLGAINDNVGGCTRHQSRSPRALASTFGPILLQSFVLLVALNLNRKIEWLWPSYWILVPVVISAALYRTDSIAAKPLVTLSQLIGLLSAA
jgi:hypothetical protein